MEELQRHSTYICLDSTVHQVESLQIPSPENSPVSVKLAHGHLPPTVEPTHEWMSEKPIAPRGPQERHSPNHTLSTKSSATGREQVHANAECDTKETTSPLLGKPPTSSSSMRGHSQATTSPNPLGGIINVVRGGDSSATVEGAWSRFRSLLQEEFQDTELVLLDWEILSNMLTHVGLTDPIEVARIQIAWRHRQHRYLHVSSTPDVARMASSFAPTGTASGNPSNPTHPLTSSGSQRNLQPRRERSMTQVTKPLAASMNVVSSGESHSHPRELTRTMSLTTALTHALLHGKVTVKQVEQTLAPPQDRSESVACSLVEDSTGDFERGKMHSYYAPYGTISATNSVDSTEEISPSHPTHHQTETMRNDLLAHSSQASIIRHISSEGTTASTSVPPLQQVPSTMAMAIMKGNPHSLELPSLSSSLPLESDAGLTRLISGITQNNATSWGTNPRSISNIYSVPSVQTTSTNAYHSTQLPPQKSPTPAKPLNFSGFSHQHQQQSAATTLASQQTGAGAPIGKRIHRDISPNLLRLGSRQHATTMRIINSSDAPIIPGSRVRHGSHRANNRSTTFTSMQH